MTPLLALHDGAGAGMVSGGKFFDFNPAAHTTHTRTDRQINRRRNRQTDRQTDRQKEEQIDEQINRLLKDC